MGGEQPGKLSGSRAFEAFGEPCSARTESTMRRCRSNSDGHTTTLAMPVSSSIVTNITPFAEPGRCLTGTGPATSSQHPSLAAIVSVQVTIRRPAR